MLIYEENFTGWVSMKFNMPKIPGAAWIFAAAVLLSAVLFSVYRYEAVSESGRGMYLIDHWTGKAYWINGEEKTEVQEP